MQSPLTELEVTGEYVASFPWRGHGSYEEERPEVVLQQIPASKPTHTYICFTRLLQCLLGLGESKRDAETTLLHSRPCTCVD